MVTSADRIYEVVKKRAVSFQLKPGERINEGALAEELGASRTPLREALNRLAAEAFLSFARGRGFSCRNLDAKQIADLYETRLVIEEASARRLCADPPVAALRDLGAFLNETRPQPGTYTAEQRTRFDEQFHERLAELAGNGEMLRILRNLNARIAFVRWIDMERRVDATQAEHRAILDAILAGDAARATAVMGAHIGRRRDIITQVVREGYSRIYCDPPDMRARIE